MVFQKFISFLKHTNVVKYFTTITICIVISEFLKTFVDKIIMPIIISFFEKDNIHWTERKKTIINPFTSNPIEIPIGLFISQILYLIFMIIITFIIYFHFIHEE